MPYSKSQQQVINLALAEADRFGATPRERKALLQALAVESNFQNLPYGDRDSLGVLQQRPSQGWRYATNPRLAVRDFLTHARKANTGRGSAGQLAQRVQRSAFPERYEQAKVSDLLGSASSQAGRPPSARAAGVAAPSAAPALPQEPSKKALLADYLARKNPNSGLVKALRLSAALEASTPTQTPPSAPQGARGPSPEPTGPSSPGKAKLLELFWQGPGGINIKNGRPVPQGFVSGHRGHVHVATTRDRIGRLARLAQRMGLTPAEHPRYGGVADVHTPTSYHYRGQALDVTGSPKQMAAYARLVAQLSRGRARTSRGSAR